jgi:hypothetical protein
MNTDIKIETENLVHRLDRIIPEVQENPELATAIRPAIYDQLRLIGIKVRKLQGILNKASGKHQKKKFTK